MGQIDIKALITVIVPIYNGELFLSACIKSVLEQSYPHWELLLIDDGSSDRSAEICERYALLDPRIFLLRLPHGGVSIARNAGLTYGRGDYFFFLDCDDLIHPQTLETELRLMQAHNSAFAGLTLTRIKADFKLSGQPMPLMPEYRCLSPVMLRNLFGNCSVYDLGAIGGKLLARSAVEGLFFPETIASGEDTLFLLDVIARIESPAVILTGSSYFRRNHQGNTYHLQTFELKMHYIEASSRLRARYFELYGTPGCWEQLCFLNVFNWYVDSQTNPKSAYYTNELRQRLLELLHDDYARFLPLKRKCTAKLYLFSPPLYWFLKKFYWRLHKLLTGKGDPALE
ncbi:MAG: glycosyltransferase [Clostridium sp.]|nr:glycosyltransferase [Clostridium sp.]